MHLMTCFGADKVEEMYIGNPPQRHADCRVVRIKPSGIKMASEITVLTVINFIL